VRAGRHQEFRRVRPAAGDHHQPGPSAITERVLRRPRDLLDRV